MVIDSKYDRHLEDAPQQAQQDALDRDNDYTNWFNKQW